MVISAILYLSVFIITFLLCLKMNRLFLYFSETRISWTKKSLLIIVILIICLPICIIAAVRGNTVGVDTSTYIGVLEEARKFSRFFEFYNYRNGEEWLYSALTFCVSRFTCGRFLYLGILQLMTVLPLMILAFRHASITPIYKTISIYFFWFFADSMNASRQYVAVAFLLLMYDHLYKKEYKRALLCLIIGSGFHSSAIMVGIGLIVFYFVINSTMSGMNKFILFILIIVLLTFGQRIFLALYSVGILPRRWILYINTFVYGDSNLSARWNYLRIGIVVEIAFRMIILVFLCFVLKREKNIELENYFIMYIMDIIIYSWGILVYHTEYLLRISVFFDFFVISILPLIDNKLIRIEYKNHNIPIFTFLVSISYWVLHAVLMNSGKTIPYVLYR